MVVASAVLSECVAEGEAYVPPIVVALRYVCVG